MPTRTRTSRSTSQTDSDNETPKETPVAEQTATETAPAEPAKKTKPEPVSPMTPYQATKRVNAALREAGIDKTVRSPMLYIYASKGAFEIHPATKITKAGQEQTVHEIDEESFVKWMTGYVKGAVQRSNGETDEAPAETDEPAEVDESAGQDEPEAAEAE